ncbi:glycosyltransferase [Paragemmobacter ruber]|uniref:Glycosyltransferase n=1 Tax=Paragemmobacter ruber TaxID=1985673 RepID=A0ABW9Y1V7_9RHOB|nr:glycosyltransferase [Rhodobacter ruber]NBE06493.1 glycosyltransferase [Rhodobacter ruber]
MSGQGHRRQVLHVLTALDFGGVESQMRLIADRGAASRWPRAFLAIGGGGAVLDALHRLGAEAGALGCAARIPSPAAAWALWRHLRRTRPAIVHLHGAEANFHGTLAARLAGVPVVIAEEIGIPRHSARARRTFAQLYRRCDRVVAISQAVKDSLILLGEATEAQVEVIHNPFQPQPFYWLPPRGAALELGFVGRLEPVKNPMAAIEAVAILRAQGMAARLRLVGDGSLRPALVQRIAELGLEDAVTLCGFDPDPFARLVGCHVYLQPSLTEGFGLAVCEAMSAGLPVIASAVGGVPEIINHGQTGWLLLKPDAAALADAITAVQAMDAADVQAIAKRAADHVVGRFSIPAYLARCDALYDRLALAAGVGR